jgi:hypothetical protein
MSDARSRRKKERAAIEWVHGDPSASCLGATAKEFDLSDVFDILQLEWVERQSSFNTIRIRGA